jgi:four helix bundle protein
MRVRESRGEYVVAGSFDGASCAGSQNVLRSHRDLEAWKKAMELARGVYAVTSSFPRREGWGLVDQMRRAAVSVPSNIAEGAARDGKTEFSRFLRIAMGSLAELETQILLAQDLGYLPEDRSPMDLLQEVRRLLSGLIRHCSRTSEQRR